MTTTTFLTEMQAARVACPYGKHTDCSYCNGTGELPLFPALFWMDEKPPFPKVPAEITVDDWLDCLEAMGYDYIIISKLSDGYDIYEGRHVQYVLSERGKTRLEALAAATEAAWGKMR